MADGGEGTAEVLSYVLGGSWKQVVVHDPLMRPTQAKYLLLPDATAVIEIAQACGLHLLDSNERNPLITSSYGVGELIIDALDEGATRIIIGLGGSATNDAGMGMLSALGIRFTDTQGNALAQGGANLIHLQHIDSSGLHPQLAQTVFEVACDVTNPLCGANGASAVFAPQKGASVQDIEVLEQALAHFADMCEQQGYGSHQHVAGAGTAGGLGYGLLSFCHATLSSGFSTVAGQVQLEEHLCTADVVITGEGQLDAQSSMGKVVGAISQLAQKHDVPVLVICGSVEGHEGQLSSKNSTFEVVMPSIQNLDSLQSILANASSNIETTAKNVASAIRLGAKLTDIN